MMARITTSETGGLRVALLRSISGERGPGCTCPAKTVLGTGETLKGNVSAPLSFITSLTSCGSMNRGGTERGRTVQHACRLSPSGPHRVSSDEHGAGAVVHPVRHDRLRRPRHLWLPQVGRDVTLDLVRG